MTDKESLDRAVEESKRDLYMEFMVSHNRGAGCVDFDDRLEALIAAVSAKAMAEERERVLTLVKRDFSLHETIPCRVEGCGHADGFHTEPPGDDPRCWSCEEINDCHRFVPSRVSIFAEDRARSSEEAGG